MYVLVELEFSTNKAGIGKLIFNLKTEFCDFYDSENLDKQLSVELVEQSVLQQIEKNNVGMFYASKDAIPFKVTINWPNETVLVESVELGEKQDITFYTYRALEVCNNFAIYNLEATE